jgi:RHS repeat-associated protein
MNQSNAAGPSYSKAVFAGDQVAMEVWGYFESTSGYGTTNNTAANLVPLIAGAFGGVSGGTGDAGLKYAGVNSTLTNYGLGANPGDAQPSAFLNYILFDKNYKVMDMGWQRVPAGSFTKQYVNIPTITVKEAGYLFVYLSYEDVSNNYVYFDDFKVTVTPTNIIQSNEYYPFGLQTANSWTRDNNVANNFLGNGGTELNTTSQLYDLDFRNYDPALGRLHQVDPLSSAYSSHSPYHYALNNPILFSDPSGAAPVEVDGNTIIINWDEFGTHGGSYSDSWGYWGYETEKQAYDAGIGYQQHFGVAGGSYEATTTTNFIKGRWVAKGDGTWGGTTSRYVKTTTYKWVPKDNFIKIDPFEDNYGPGPGSDQFHYFMGISNQWKAYNFMTDMQRRDNVELSALIVRDENNIVGIIVQPWENNTKGTSPSIYRGVREGYKTATLKGIDYRILATIHTHPDDTKGYYEGPSGPNNAYDGGSGDLGVYERTGWTMFTIGPTEVSKLNPNFPTKVTSWFDNNITPRLGNPHSIGKTEKLLNRDLSLFNYVKF